MIRICRHFDYRESAIYTKNDITWFYDYDLISLVHCVSQLLYPCERIFFFQNVFDNAFDSHCLSKIKIFEEKTLLVNGEKKTGSKSFVDFYGPRLPYEHIKLFIPRSLSTRILMLIRN